MSDSFLSRWSKRKLEVRAQEKLAETPSPAVQEPEAVTAVPASTASVPAAQPAVPDAPQAELPLPTEADLKAVEQGGDIKAFMVDKVSAELKNKAFKALFSRPEFNVMDGLDIYIDDYNKFIPLSQEDIGKMTFSKQLLSRPDLEIPKTSDIVQALDMPGSGHEKPAASLASVSDKPLDEELEQVQAIESEDRLRVIPDESQAIDSNNKSEKHSFEKPDSA